MTEVQIVRAPDGAISEFKVQGHASYGRQGEDIVCAAVSVLSQTAILGLEKVAQHPVKWTRRDGYLSCKLKPGASPEAVSQAQAILETVVLGLRDIATGYPNYVLFTEGG